MNDIKMVLLKYFHFHLHGNTFIKEITVSLCSQKQISQSLK